MKKLMLVCVALASAISSSVAFCATDSAKQRAAVNEAVESVCKQADVLIKDAKVLRADMPIYLWVRGGKEKEANTLCERLLLQALVDNGKTSVVSDDDEKDKNFKRFLDQLARIVLSKEGTRGFDEETSKPVDLGKLKNARIFLDAHLYVQRRTQRKFTAELYLEAFDINTKERIWVKNLSSFKGDSVGVVTLPIGEKMTVLPPKAVNISMKTVPVDDESKAVAQEISDDVSGLLAARGYILQGAAREPDVTLELRVRRDLFDKLGNWYVFSGRVRAKARLNGKSGRDLGQRSFDGKGTRGLTIAEAEKSLVKELASKIDEWAAGVIDPGVLNLMTEAVVLEFAEQSNEAEGQGNMEKFRRSVAEIPGCRTFEVKSRTVRNGIATVTFRAVYMKDRFPGGIMPGVFAEKPELANLLLAD